MRIDLWIDHKQELIAVLILNSPDVQAVHDELLRENLTHSHDDFNVHITVGKDVQNDAQTRVWVDGRNEYLRVCPLPIVFDPKLKGSSVA